MEKNSIKDLIFEIKKTPGLYLTEDSIVSLNSFLTGWMVRDIDTIKDLEVINQFEIWVKHKYNLSEGTQGWSSIILFHSANGYTALQRFFQLFDEFITDL